MCLENMMCFEKFQGELCAQQDSSAYAVFGTSDRLGGAISVPQPASQEVLDFCVQRAYKSACRW